MVRQVTFLDAVVATTTSAAVGVKYAKKITLMLTQADHSSGNFVFTVLGSVDGTNFVALNNLRDNSTGVLTLVSSKTLSTDTSTLLTVDLAGMGMCLTHLKVVGTRTTDGTATVVGLIESEDE